MTEEEKAARLAALRAEQARRQQAAAAPAAATPPPAQAVATPAPQQRPDLAAVVGALAADGGIDTDQNRMVNFAFELQDRQRAEQERLRKEAERRQEEGFSEDVAGIALDYALNPEADPSNPAGVLNDPRFAGMSNNDRINALIRMGELTAEEGPLGALVNPETEPDAISAAAADRYREQSNARIENSLQARLLREAEQYAGDPVNGLIRDLELGRDGETRDDFDRLDLERRIEALATEYNMPPERVAVAMQESFIRDPGDDGGGFFDFDLTRNTMENRFPEDRIRSFIETNLSPEAIAAHKNRVDANRNSQRELSALQTELRELRVNAERYRQTGQPMPPELEIAIADTQSRIRTWGQAPAEPEPEPERDPNPSDTVSDDRIREAMIYGNNYFTEAGIMPHIMHMRSGAGNREETLARIQAHLENDGNLTPDQKNILWAVANQ